MRVGYETNVDEGDFEMATTKRDEFFKTMYDKAVLAGTARAEKCVPTPMIVSQRANPLDDTSAVEKEWLVPQGVCGFAWVSLKAGNCAFAKWLKKNDYARTDSYAGGICIWVQGFGQSMEMKMAYAGGFSNFLNENIDALGFKSCYADSRMD